ncbi:hypothetical protein N2605_16240 [Bradyrhizobium yuanmingense]|uniref:hypothetical protein n=1 Tax=Bradyrhizobium yuanmingense TaxID=108015 RepID=UPI0021A63D71|nr:hypothetical protein [Bradyrhizobium sp. CB1024]UWU87926.1 hypothetical protein N2605_16240 [Bradyrhizobium sp. CB1024]
MVDHHIALNRGMKKFFSVLLAAVALIISPIEARAQQYQTLPPNSVIANTLNYSNPSHALPFSELLKILNLYSLTKVGDADYVMGSTDRVVTTDKLASWHDPHTWTLPRAADFNPGQPLYVIDLGSKITADKPLTIVRNSTGGDDRINGGISPVVINVASGAFVFISDGYSNWFAHSLVSPSTAPDGTIRSNISGITSTLDDNPISAVLDKLLGTTHGSVVYRGASSWSALSPGTLGQLLSSGGAGANPSWITANGTGTVTSVMCFGSAITTIGTCATAATKSDQQTATSTTAVVTPSQQQSHPSAAKAWVRFTGVSGAISQAYNVASVTRSSAGSYTLNFSTAFANTTYTCVGNIEDTASNGIIKGASSGRSGSANPIFAVNLAGTTYDPATVEVACFGTQ